MRKGLPSDSVREFVAQHDDRLERAFPALHFDWHPAADVLTVEILSHAGTKSRVMAGYPLNLDLVYEGARRHLDEDARRDRLADRLVAAAWGDQIQRPAGHHPLILRWLVQTRCAEVIFGDQPEVQPVVGKPSVALVHSSTRKLKVWADGAAVLHYDESLSAGAELLESRGLDLPRLSLRDFQALWLATEPSSPPGDVPAAPSGSEITSSEAAALSLLRDYDAGAWLQHHRFADECLQSDGTRIDWVAANRLSTLYTEATVQDRAVLAVACHLSDIVTPHVSMLDALHCVGAARWDVLKALDSVTGRHPDPHAGWPVDCSTCS